jgi:hypothetical protein
MIKFGTILGFSFATALLCLMTSVSSQPLLGASAAAPVVTSATVNYTNNQITLHGQNFSPSGAAPTVVFNGQTLTLVSFSNQTVVATLPSNIPAGAYRLTITNPAIPNQSGELDVTIGVNILVTGALFGYYRVPDVQTFSDNRPCSALVSDAERWNYSTLPKFAIPRLNGADQFLRLKESVDQARGQHLVLGTGNNFGRFYWARALWNPGNPNSYPAVLRDEYTPYYEPDHSDVRRWISIEDNPEAYPDLEAQHSELRAKLPSDNVSCFLAQAGYDAVVPGPHDFAYGPARLRELAEFLGNDQRSEFNGRHVLMLASNLVIRTKWHSDHETIPASERPAVNFTTSDTKITPVLPKPNGYLLPYAQSFLVSVKDGQDLQNRTPHLCNQDRNTGRVEENSGCETLAADPERCFKKSLCEIAIEKSQRHPFYTGQNYALCFDPPSAANQQRFCIPFVIDLPYFTSSSADATWLALSQAAERKEDCDYPMPYCLRQINGTWAVVFGVVDTDLQSRVGLSNFGWVNEKPASSSEASGPILKHYVTQVVVTDPVESLRQAIQLFISRHPDLNSDNAYWVLLAGMPPDKAGELAVRIGGILRNSTMPKFDFDLVISEADEKHKTPDGSIALNGAHGEMPPPPVFVPEPHFNPRGEIGRSLFAELSVSRTHTGEIQARSVEIKTDSVEIDPLDSLKENPEFRAAVGKTYLRLGGKFASNPGTPSQQVEDIIEEITLHAMREAAHSDLALLQEQDFYWPWVTSGTTVMDAAQGMFQRVLWKDNFLVILSVPGAVLKKVMNQSKKYSQQDADVLSDEVLTKRAILSIGMKEDPDRKTYFINGFPMQDDKLYTVATTEYIALGDTGYPDLLTGSVSPPQYLSNFSGLLKRISALLCRNFKEPNACEPYVHVQNYLDAVSILTPDNPGPYGTGMHEFRASLPFYKSSFKSALSTEFERHALDHKTQTRPYTLLSLENLSVGFNALAHEFTQNGLVSRFSGVVDQQANQPKFHSLDFDDHVKFLRSYNKVDFYAAQAIQYSAKYTQQTNFPASVSQSMNRLSGEIGVYWHPQHERIQIQSWLSLVMAARTEAAIVDPEQLFKASNPSVSQSPFPVRAEFPRTWLTLGRTGLRGEKNKSFFEVGLEGGEAFGAFSDFRFFDPVSNTFLLECPLIARVSLGSCVQNSKNLIPGAKFVVSQTDRSRYGFYGKWRLVLPIGSKVQLQAADEGDLFFNSGGDNSTDTRYRNQLTESIQFNVFPSLSFEPQYILFLYSNKVDYHFLWQQQTQIKVTWSFDLHTGTQGKREVQFPDPDQKSLRVEP